MEKARRHVRRLRRRHSATRFAWTCLNGEMWSLYAPGIAHAFSQGRLQLVDVDGQELDTQAFSGIVNIRQLREILALHLFTAADSMTLSVEDGGVVLMDSSDIQDSEQLIRIKVSTVIADLVAEQKIRLFLGHDPLYIDLSPVRNVCDIRLAVAKATFRPLNFVRLEMYSGNVLCDLDDWSSLPATAAEVVIHVVLIKTIAELFQEDQVQLSLASGEELKLNADAQARLIDTLDLRRAIAEQQDTIPECVQIITPAGKEVSDEDALALSVLDHEAVLTICIHERIAFPHGEIDGVSNHCCLHLLLRR